MFNDRFDAAHQLALHLTEYKNNKDVVVVAIPRGGLELGYVMAKELSAPLDVLLTKKIGAPHEPEVAIGSVSLDHELIDPRFEQLSHAYREYIDEEVKNIRKTLKERYLQYRGTTQPLDLKNKIVILTDDGVATGHTLLAAIELIKKEHPQKIVVAVPVAPRETARKIQQAADELVCLLIPSAFYSVSQFYDDFSQVEDETAIHLLAEAQR
jgi:predicted phosphoribosyltransferase